MRIGRWPPMGDRPSRARATARSAVFAPLHAMRNVLAVVWFKRYGLPRETRIVGFSESVVVMSAPSESGMAMLPRHEIGRTLVTNATRECLAITTRAES